MQIFGNVFYTLGEWIIKVEWLLLSARIAYLGS